MKTFCNKHAGFYESNQGCLYCQPAQTQAVSARSLIGWNNEFQIDHYFPFFGLTWMDMEAVYKDTLLKASTTLMANTAISSIDLTCVIGTAVAEQLVKNLPTNDWKGPTNAQSPSEFLGEWCPTPGYNEVWVYSDIYSKKQFLPSDCVIITTILVDGMYLLDPNYDVMQLFSPLEVTVTARG